MKRHTQLILTGIMALLATAAFAQQPFEGIITAHGEGAGVTNSAALHVKGNRARLYPQNASLSTNGLPILDYDTMKITLLTEKEKYYLEMPLEALENNLKAQPLALKPTGKKETILGLAAEEFKGSDPETGVDIITLGTKDFSTKLNVLIGFQKMSTEGLALSKTSRALLDKGYFPLRVNAAKGSKLSFTWEVRGIEKKAIDEKILAVPAGYLKFSEYMKKKDKKSRGR